MKITYISNYFDLIIHMVLSCAGVSAIAARRSFICAKIPRKVRIGFLILSFKNEKISIFCVIIQAFNYLLIISYLLSRLTSIALIFPFFADFQRMTPILLIINLFGIGSLAAIETIICSIILYIQGR